MVVQVERESIMPENGGTLNLPSHEGDISKAHQSWNNVQDSTVLVSREMSETIFTGASVRKALSVTETGQH